MTAKVLAYDDKGLPAISENKRGAGKVFYVNFPLEAMLIERSHAFNDDYYRVYRELFRDAIAAHEVTTESPFVSVTLHREENGEIVCAAVNYSYAEQTPSLRPADGYAIGELLYGTPDRIPAFDAAIFRLKQA